MVSHVSSRLNCIDKLVLTVRSLTRGWVTMLAFVGFAVLFVGVSRLPVH